MLSKQISKITYTIANRLRRDARVRRTIRELSALSNKDLADIGVNRCDIPRIAEEANGNA